MSSLSHSLDTIGTHEILTSPGWTLTTDANDSGIVTSLSAKGRQGLTLAASESELKVYTICAPSTLCVSIP